MYNFKQLFTNPTFATAFLLFTSIIRFPVESIVLSILFKNKAPSENNFYAGFYHQENNNKQYSFCSHLTITLLSPIIIFPFVAYWLFNNEKPTVENVENNKELLQTIEETTVENNKSKEYQENNFFTPKKNNEQNDTNNLSDYVFSDSNDGNSAPKI